MARYIDADEALRVMRNVKSDKPSYGDWELACDCCIGMVEVVPTADVVEVKRGNWEKRTFIVFDNEIKDGYHCSECNTTWDTDTNFCPNCGAKMEGERKEK